MNTVFRAYLKNNKDIYIVNDLETLAYFTIKRKVVDIKDISDNIFYCLKNIEIYDDTIIPYSELSLLLKRTDEAIKNPNKIQIMLKSINKLVNNEVINTSDIIIFLTSIRLLIYIGIEKKDDIVFDCG